MRWVAAVRECLRALMVGDRQDAEMDEELRFHLEREAELLQQTGLDAREARRQARLRFGGVPRVKEEVREARGIHLVESLGKDVRYSGRMLCKRPGFAETHFEIIQVDEEQGVERVLVEVITGDYFPTLGIRAHLGRAITPADDRRPGGHPVVMLTHAVTRLLAGNGVRLVLTSSVLGLIVSVLASRVLGGFLFGIETSDPVVLTSAPLLFVVTAVLASYLPVRRASRANPVAALRAE